MEGLSKYPSCCLIYLSLSLTVRGLGSVGTCSSFRQFIPGLPGRDGRDGLPGKDGRDGTPGTFSYSDYRRLKEELRTELKQELLNELRGKPDCYCTSTPTPSSTHHPSAISTENTDLNSATSLQSIDLSTPVNSQSKFVTSLPTVTPQSTTSLFTTMSPSTTHPPTPGPIAIGSSEDRPAQSCHHIYQTDSSLLSGYYWINTTEGPIEAYCVMNPPDCNITGGWMRVVLHNMTDPNTACLGNTHQYTVNGKRFCAVSSGYQCVPVVFPVNGLSYSHVCGRALGYSFHQPCALYHNTRLIYQNYLTGLSITHGPLNENANHVWSFVAGYREEGSQPCNCPCAKYPGNSPPSYVGTDYYCDTATVTYGSSQWYTNNTLWDGKDCYPGSNCCASTQMPWFLKSLEQETSNDITVRWCADRSLSSTNIGTEFLEIYIH